MKTAIKIKDLGKKYDDTFALEKINLEIPSGCIIGLIGENGTGKTTLIKSILNILKIDHGEIEIFEQNLNKNEYKLKEDIGVVLDNMFFPELLTPKDINIIMQGIYKNWDSNLYFKYLNDFKLPFNKNLKTMSKGMHKKIEIATALAHKPKLLILDEPTSGLDPVVRTEILDIFLDFIQDEDHTILLSTHITSDLEHIADQIIFLDQGKIILNENRDELLDNYAILKCDTKEFKKIDKTDIISYKKNKYNYEILIKDKTKMLKKYKEYIIDKITIEDLMLLILKGEK